jgi:hypothetical protein
MEDRNMLFEEAENAWVEAGLPAGDASSPTGFSSHDRFPLRIEAVVNEYGSIRLHLDIADLTNRRRSYVDEPERLAAVHDQGGLTAEEFRTNEGRCFGP